MFGKDHLYRVAFVEGDVTLTHENLGTKQVTRGMKFSDASSITIRTGLSSRVIVITPRGDAMDIGEMSCETIVRQTSQDFVDTLQNIRVTARDMMASRRKVTLQTLVNS